MQQVLARLYPTEPNYAVAAAKLGPEALPHLETIIKTSESLLASKAAYLSSLIDDERSVTVLKVAAQSNHPEVRLAAASGARNLSPTSADKVLVLLKDDQDPSVRRQVSKRQLVD
jgi:HEAT repeat protein